MLNTACIGKVLGTKIPQRIKWIKFLPSWYLHLTNRYCLYVKILCLCFRAYKQHMEFIIQWDNKKHITDGRKRHLSQKETIFIGWGRELGGRRSNTGMNPHHILKLYQFIIGFFSYIPISGTLKPNWTQVFQRFTFWLLQIRESHTLL